MIADFFMTAKTGIELAKYLEAQRVHMGEMIGQIPGSDASICEFSRAETPSIQCEGKKKKKIQAKNKDV